MEGTDKWWVKCIFAMKNGRIVNCHKQKYWPWQKEALEDKVKKLLARGHAVAITEREEL